MRALVTGADGFVGRHLVAHLRESGDTVVEATGPSGDPAPDRYPLDVRDAEHVAQVLASADPEAVYHLAAVAYGPDARADLPAAVAITVMGTAHLLEAASRAPSPPTVLIAGSAEVYGAPAVDLIDEETAPRPVNLYGATKLAQEAIGIAFGRAHGLPVIATRSFNHIGPGQRESFAVASFARQLVEVRSGRRPPTLEVGNLAPIRDFTDVRDVVRAYRGLVAGGGAGLAINVASGRGISIGDLLEQLIAASGLSVSVEVDPERIRAEDPPRIVGSSSLLKGMTGWAPKIPLSRTLRDVWADALERWL